MLVGFVTTSGLFLFGNVTDNDIKNFSNIEEYDYFRKHYIGWLVNSDAFIEIVDKLPIDRFFFTNSNNNADFFKKAVQADREEAMEWFHKLLPNSRKNMR